MNKRISVLVVAISLSSSLLATEKNEPGLIDGSSLKIIFRNTFFERDFKDGVRDRGEWGQAAMAKFASGYTPGTIGVGVEGFGFYALRLDGGRGRSGQGGIDFFKQDSNGRSAKDIARAGGAVNLKVSNTVLKYGEQTPAYPVVAYSDTRLLPETYTGTSIRSRELDWLDFNAARFTAEARRSAAGQDSGRLDSIDVVGADITPNKNLRMSLYHSDVKNFFNKSYGSAAYTFVIDNASSFTLDFRGYKTDLDSEYASRLGGDHNTIWSLAATYQNNGHSLIVANQRSSGDIGYPYGGYQSLRRPGDGGSTMYLANSFWSDFNGKDEVSWQLGYGYDFSAAGMPGLSYRFAYVRGTGIDTSTGAGSEREIFNMVKYVVQSGPLKDLSFRVRSSILRVSNNAAAYNISGNEIRTYVEYPLNIF